MPCSKRTKRNMFVVLHEAELGKVEVQNDVFDVVEHASDVLRICGDGEVWVEPFVFRRLADREELSLDELLGLLKVRAAW